MQSRIEIYMLDWLVEHDVTRAELSRMIGKNEGYITNMLYRKTLSLEPYRLIDKVVNFPPELLQEQEAAKKRQDKIKAIKVGQALKKKNDNRPLHPWRITVDRFLTDPPIYSRRWA